MKIYNLHSPRDKFYSNKAMSLKDVTTLAKSMNLNMIDCFISDGLNTFEDKNPNKAVIFDIQSEDVIKIEK